MDGTIYVYGDWEELKVPSLIGKLNVEMLRGKEIFSFEYDEEWLSRKHNTLFDSDLQFFKGRQYSSDEKHFFRHIHRFLSRQMGKNASPEK